MKALCLALLATLAVGQSALAETCKTTVEQAAQAYAQRGNRRAVDVRGSKLVSSGTSVRHYLVTLVEQYADYGATYEFPAEYLLVTATGTQYDCTVRNIKRK